VLLEESMCNVGVIKCYVMNCCQHFPHEKNFWLRQKFWNLSFEDHKTYGLDIQEGCIIGELEVDENLSLFKL